MNKKVLILSSSPRKGGNSDMLCDEFLSGAEKNGNTVEKIFLKDKRINYCTGCSVCSEKQLPCPQKDDVSEIVEKMIAADIIVLSTPVYFYTMSAQMKTLIDRCCARYIEINGKDFYLILSAADTEKKNLERTVDTFQGFFDCLENPSLKGVIYGTGVWKLGEIKNSPFLKEAYEMGRKA